MNLKRLVVTLAGLAFGSAAYAIPASFTSDPIEYQTTACSGYNFCTPTPATFSVVI